MAKEKVIKYIKSEREIIYVDISARISELLTSYSKLIIAIETRKGISEMIADFKAHAEPLLVYLKLLYPQEVKELREKLDNLAPTTPNLLLLVREIVDEIITLINKIVEIIKEQKTGIGI